MLAGEDVAQFIELGHCRLESAFDPTDAGRVCDRVWERMQEKQGISRDVPTTWPGAYDIEERIDAGCCFTDRLAIAIEQLVGEGRWIGAREWGFWPVNFGYPGLTTGHTPDEGWHIDGNWFRHTLDCPRQGLLLIGLFTDLDPGGGGTILAERSHRRAARILANHSEGLTHLELFDAVLSEPLGGFHEITGRAGDVVLAHPFMCHARGRNLRGRPRIISNTEAPLREPIRWDRVEHERSPLESSIARALVETDEVPHDAMRCRF